ncbi:MAG: IclR family transcriptional regulator [Salinigranum sp.]
MESTNGSGDAVKSNETLFDVVEGLAELSGATGTELAAHIDQPESTVYRHLQSLSRREYVVRADGEYRLGFRFLNLGSEVQRDTAQFAYLDQKLRGLARETGEVVQLVHEEHGRGCVVLSKRGDGAVKAGTHVGSQVPLHQTAGGKAILAALSGERRESILARRGLPANTPQTITDRDDLRNELETIRDRGFAIAMGDRIEELWSVGVAIADSDGGVFGAVNVAAPAHRLEGEWFATDLPRTLVGVANEIELQINQLSG